MPEDRLLPHDVDIDRERGVTITYVDGHRCFFENDRLRAACPCAACRGRREAGEDAWPIPGTTARARIDSAELVGAWGLNVRWVDGHDTGIYPWAALREWCEADERA